MAVGAEDDEVTDVLNWFNPDLTGWWDGGGCLLMGSAVTMAGLSPRGGCGMTLTGI